MAHHQAGHRAFALSAGGGEIVGADVSDAATAGETGEGRGSGGVGEALVGAAGAGRLAAEATGRGPAASLLGAAAGAGGGASIMETGGGPGVGRGLGAGGFRTSAPAERTTGSRASTGPCAAGAVRLGVGGGRLQSLSDGGGDGDCDWAWAGTTASTAANATISAPREMVLPPPHMMVRARRIRAEPRVNAPWRPRPVVARCRRTGAPGACHRGRFTAWPRDERNSIRPPSPGPAQRASRLAGRGRA